MGQQLPLPYKIPKPVGDQCELFQEMGIIVCNNNDNENAMYVSYTLPNGWRMVDNSFREDIPIFIIIDNKDMIRVRISGSWKGSYDNKLRMRVCDKLELEKYTKPESELINASETSGPNLIGQFAQALDPEQRPYVKTTTVNQHEDFIPN